MANVHETRAVSLTLEADQLAPLFLPLTDLAAGCILIPSQCVLTVTNVPSPLSVAVLLCEAGTVVGHPGDAVLQMGERFDLYADLPTVMQGGNVPPLEAGGVLGLYVPVQTLTTGARVEGMLSVVCAS